MVADWGDRDRIEIRLLLLLSLIGSDGRYGPLGRSKMSFGKDLFFTRGDVGVFCEVPWHATSANIIISMARQRSSRSNSCGHPPDPLWTS